MEEETTSLLINSTLLFPSNDTIPIHGTCDARFEEQEHSFVDFHHTKDPLTIALTLVIIAFMKAVVTKIKILPHSVCLLLGGICMGFVIYRYKLLFHEEDLDDGHTVSFDFHLKPTWFFDMLLPIIVFDSGFSMKNKDFFSNIGTISLFAVVGTIINIAMLTGLLFYCTDLFSIPCLDFKSIVLFATIISAVDPVAVLTVFEDIQVNEILHICVFGESLLNDAVTIVLYKGIIGLPDGATILSSITLLIGNFFYVSCFGIIIGVIGGYLLAAICRWGMLNDQQWSVVLLLTVPYMTYMMAESFKASGLIALIVTGMIAKNYALPNTSEMMIGFIEILLKFLCSYAEAITFVFLGISLLGILHETSCDWVFFAVTMVGITVFRFVGVFGLTAIVNNWRQKNTKIGHDDQFIMSYAGLRGAVCYGLIMVLPDNLSYKPHFTLITMLIVIFTTVVQGSTINYVVRALKVRMSKKHRAQDELDSPDHQYKVFKIVQREVQRRVLAFVEELSHTRRSNWLFHKFEDFDEVYLKPLLISNYDSGTFLMKQHEQITIEEMTEGIRCGSFAGLSHVNSAAKLAISHSSSDIESGGLLAPREPRVQFNLSPDRPQMPRNESVSGFAQQVFDRQGAEATRQRGHRVSVYSRHMLDMAPATPTSYESDNESTLEDRNYTFTYPGPKPDKGKLARDIRAFALSRKSSKSPSRNRPGTALERQTNSARSAPQSASLRIPRFSLSPAEDTIGTKEQRPKVEKKVSVGRKKFTIGEDVELIPIDEEDHDSSSADNTRHSIE